MFPEEPPDERRDGGGGEGAEEEEEKGFEIVDTAEIDSLMTSSSAGHLGLLSEHSSDNRSGGKPLGCSLSWDDFADIKFCPLCRNLLDPLCSKVHCISCGKVFCGQISCIEYMKLDGVLYSQRKAPICKICHEASETPVNRNPSESASITVSYDKSSDSKTTSLLNSSSSSQNIIQFPVE